MLCINCLTTFRPICIRQPRNLVTKFLGGGREETQNYLNGSYYTHAHLHQAKDDIILLQVKTATIVSSFCYPCIFRILIWLHHIAIADSHIQAIILDFSSERGML